MNHSDEFIDSFVLDLWVVHLELGDAHECILFCFTVAEEVSDQVRFDDTYVVADGLVVFQDFKESEVERDNLALKYFRVTVLLPVPPDIQEEALSFHSIHAT